MDGLSLLYHKCFPSQLNFNTTNFTQILGNALKYFYNYILFPWRGATINLSKKYIGQLTSGFASSSIVLPSIGVHHGAYCFFSANTTALMPTLSWNWGDCDGFPRKNEQTLYTGSYYMDCLHLYLNLMLT